MLSPRRACPANADVPLDDGDARRPDERQRRCDDDRWPDAWSIEPSNIPSLDSRSSEVVFAINVGTPLAAESGLFGCEHTDLSHKLALARGHLFADSDDIHLGVLDLGK